MLISCDHPGPGPGVLGLADFTKHWLQLRFDRYIEYREAFVTGMV